MKYLFMTGTGPRVTVLQLVFVLYVIAISSTNSLGQDTLVWLNELSFNSLNEKEAFYQAINEHKPDHFKLLNYGKLSETDRSKNKFYGYLRGLDIENKGGKKNSKRVKYIYESVHQAFLTKYQGQESF
ncbi:MAG: hypothetical protein ACK514_01075 [Bacteroidota bacterium]|jgi:hypothetical protein|nr:hypothetical protein [Cytophagales bacterium]MCE2956983.1 hypothetical protein [Flammeovirgaceae bacterium]MCZ8072288.1 hypothetical protein [Cytophagales bacterium]